MSTDGSRKLLSSSDGAGSSSSDMKSYSSSLIENQRNTGESSMFEDMKNSESNKMEEEIEWTPETCTKLLYAMAGHKPAGVNKHFEMACIMEKFQYIMKRKIPVSAVWNQLNVWYNLDAVDAIEGITFPNDETEFHLPEDFFTSSSEEIQETDEALQKEKKVEGTPKVTVKKEKEESPDIKILKPSPKVENVKGRKDKFEQSKQKETPFKSPKAKLTYEDIKKRKRRDSSD